MADDIVKPVAADQPLTALPAVPVPVAPAVVKGPGTVPALDALFGVGGETALAKVIFISPDQEFPELARAESVDAALPLIGRMLMAEKAQTGQVKRMYPRKLLRQQHIVAYMLCNPFADTAEICAFFQISPSTFYTIAKSDTFKALVSQHRVSIDAGIGGDLKQQLEDTLGAAIGVVQKAVVDKQDPDFALAAMDKVANRLGMGVKHTGPNVQINNNIVTPEMIEAARAARKAISAG